MKHKKLMVKILSWIGIPVAVVYILAMVFVTQNVRQSVSQLTESNLTEKSQASASQVEAYLSKYIGLVEQLKNDTTFQYYLDDINSKSSVMDVNGWQQIESTVSNMTRADENIMDTWVIDSASNHCIDMIAGISERKLESRPWYKTLAASKKTVITDPYEDPSTQVMTVSIVTPYYRLNGGSMTGVIGIDISLNRLYKTIKSYKLGKKGFYILTSTDGGLVYFPNEAMKSKNITASGMSKNVIQAIQSKKQQFLSYTAFGKTNYGYISTVGNTGWTITTGLPSDEFFSSYQTIFLNLLWTFVAALAVIIALIVFVSKSITKPLIRLKDTANSIADGNLDVSVGTGSSDETGQVANAISKTVIRLKQYISYIDEISLILNQLAEGNLVYELHCDYVGEFSKIKDALENIQKTLMKTISHIDAAADQVASGSEQISNASQALSQGATEQASSIEELTASVTEISHNIERNAEDAANASSLSESVASEFMHGNELMRQMMDAMTNISTSSSEISKIIKAIQDIAFQTNILALNAAVEAARAGEAGKGFSVVAEEVRNLAGKSAEAAKNTNTLVQTEIQSVRSGSKIADETSQMFGKIADSSTKSAGLVNQIAAESKQQSASIQQVTQGLNQISSVVQNNSATAEESAASSEELSKQAQSLRELIQRFKTK